jgi:hypothetical protein
LQSDHRRHPACDLQIRRPTNLQDLLLQLTINKSSDLFHQSTAKNNQYQPVKTQQDTLLIFKMPVIPESSDFPSAPHKEGNEAEKKPGQQLPKATATDFLSKGPQIPDSKLTARLAQARD